MSGRGDDPILQTGDGAETSTMTHLALRYDTRRGRFGRVLDGDKDLGRAGAATRTEAMDLSREMKMQELRERIAHDDYRVDAQAVARAIVARLLAGTHRDEAAGEPGPQCS
jgi:Anti-sigma-28 factor, FlgM